MRIGIVGHFGGHKNFTDGQSVKVKSLYNALLIHSKGIKIDKVDTYYLKSNPIKFVLDVIKCIIVDRKIIFFPAYRGRKFLFPFFYYVKLIFRKDIFHDCIAGSLDKEIEDNKKWKKYLNKFDSNWMESPEQVEKLIKIGISNCIYIPNFKNIQPIKHEAINAKSINIPFRFCTFSRVESKKGIEDALIAIRNINLREGYTKATLDVYGPIQKGHELWFENIQQKYQNECIYKGCAQPDESVEILKDYFALLFPTQYYTEGMPGTIIDAMFAGIPVIARRWAWCSNMITDNYNGISYDFDKPELLEQIIEDVINHPEKIISLKHNCVQESEKYSESKIIKDIIKIIKI